MKRTLRTVSRLARRAMSALLALVAMTTLPIPVWAEDETASTTTVEAKWGTSVDNLTAEGTLAEAINAAEASGSTVAYIQLQAGVTTTDEHFISSGTFTLDLNGQTLTREDGSTLLINGSGATVTLTDASVDKNGKVAFTGSGHRAFEVSGGASVTIQAGTYESSAVAVAVYAASTTTIISGGTFTGGSGLRVIENFGSLTVSGGSFGGTGIAASVQTLSGSSTTITGGTLTEGFSGTIFYQGGTLDLTGYTAFTGFSVYNYSGDASSISLPAGYCFYDSSNAATTVLGAGKYTIGTEPETKYTITYAAGGGTGEMAAAVSYGAHTLPECTFTAPADKMFKAWQVGETEYQPGAVVTVSANTTVTAVWVVPYTVSFDANGGEGTIENIMTISTCTLPECTFTAPADKMFKAWQVGETEYQPGAVVTVSTNTTVTAVWRDYVPQIVIEMKDQYEDGWHGDAIVIKKDGEEVATATIESGNSATLSLDYDNSCEYTFYWKFSTGTGNRYPDECSFEIFVAGESVLAVAQGGCTNYTDGQLLHTIEIQELTEESVAIADGELESYEVKALTHVGTLTYTRTLNAGWNALFVPFEIPVSELESGYDVAYFNDVHSYDTDSDGDIDNMEMELIKVQSTQTLKANYPYMIRPKSEADQSLSLTLTDATLYKTVSDTVTCSSVFMKYEVAGTYTTMSSTDLDGRLVVTTEGGWALLNASSTLKPFRLHMKLITLPGSPVKVLETALLNNLVVTVRLRGESGATGIAPVELLPTEAPAIYDLMGRPVANPLKGQIYIVNGKKVVY